ncbi:MAG: alpha/beta hydrolase [Candidatus Protistobacter heckmanni]|nr:alpha/beta hydrolase [Candidatus Protistobacter heckmanni]
MALVELALARGPVRIEYEWLRPEAKDRPLLVFLHEGLGSVAMWKDFPARLCAEGDFCGLVYSRPGYGKSSPRPAGEKRPVGFMHDQAREVLPALLDALDIGKGAGKDADDLPRLFGHSDGCSITLIYAASFPRRLAGAVVVAPHTFVEDFSPESIRQAREAYAGGKLAQRLAPYHDDVDSAFHGWNDVWLDPEFRKWSIEALLPEIVFPLLAVQGFQDEYGTMEQIEKIGRAVPSSKLVKLDRCRHSPHSDQPDALIEATSHFIKETIACATLPN